ncbi:hypothetical protein [Anaerotruncus rubiinfantis]|uniref:hypothetical protein n=1 Tax=Anaerotruncus rubiinfantis TaxID=1720200 RepID=UPI003D7B37EA
MGFSEDVIARGKSALAILRDDHAKVMRLDPYGESIDADTVIYDSLPCHLSQTTLPVSEGEDTASQTTTVFTLFVDDGADIRQGDEITVTHKGQVFTGTAGLPLRGTFSLSVKLESVRIS